MKQFFATILALALLLFTTVQAADLATCKKDEDCDNGVKTSADPAYKCCAYMHGKYLGVYDINGHYCALLVAMREYEKRPEEIPGLTAYCDGASYITAAFATLLVSIFTLAF